MSEIETKAARDSWDLALLIARMEEEEATRREQEARVDPPRRPQWQDMDTVNFATLDEDNDWSDV